MDIKLPIRIGLQHHKNFANKNVRCYLFENAVKCTATEPTPLKNLKIKNHKRGTRVHFSSYRRHFNVSGVIFC